MKIYDFRTVYLSDIADVPTMEIGYSGIKIQPSSVKLTYQRADFGPWLSSTTEVTGFRLKANGAPGKAVSSKYVPDAERPQWLSDLVELHMPKVGD